MFCDSLLRLSDAQAITVDAVSTNTIDLASITPQRQIGTGEPLCIVITVDVAADFTTTDETYTFQVISSAAAALTTPTVLCQRQILASALTVGSIHVLPIPVGTPLQRYLGLNYDVAGTTPTVTVTADLMPLSMASIHPLAHASGFTVS